MKWGMLSIQSSTVLCLSSFGIWATPVNSFCHDIFDDGWWSYTSQTYRILPLIYIINKKDWLVKVGMKHNWELLVIPNLVETKLVKLEVTFVCLDMVQPMGFSLFYKGAVPGLQVRYCRAVIQDVMPPNDHWSFLIYIYIFELGCVPHPSTFTIPLFQHLKRTCWLRSHHRTAVGSFYGEPCHSRCIPSKWREHRIF